MFSRSREWLCRLSYSLALLLCFQLHECEAWGFPADAVESKTTASPAAPQRDAPLVLEVVNGRARVVAPFSLERYVEVDVTVPQGIQPGNAPVVVSIAGNQSQAAVTLAVK